MSPSLRPLVMALLLLPGAQLLYAQRSSSPTLPSDTLEANYGPRGTTAPTPELSPTLPSDTLEATRRVDSFPTDPIAPGTGHTDRSLERSPAPAAPPAAPDDSAVLRELRGWIDRHPDVGTPPPVRAVLVRV